MHIDFLSLFANAEPNLIDRTILITFPSPYHLALFIIPKSLPDSTLINVNLFSKSRPSNKGFKVDNLLRRAALPGLVLFEMRKQTPLPSMALAIERC